MKMFNRRAFIRTSILAGGAGLLRGGTVHAAEKDAKTGYFDVHPFVDMHPDAVFVMRTSVDRKTDSDALKKVGLGLGRTLFVPSDKTGVPLSTIVAAKPNITAHNVTEEKRGLTLEDTMGITTDPFFVEGIFESMKELGVSGGRMHVRDINGGQVAEPRGYTAMSQRVGGTAIPAKARIATEEDAADAASFVWRDVPGGVIHTKMPYLWPFNAPDAWNLNIAKFKAHTMGLTLASKNWQGADASPFQGYCQKWPTIERLQTLEKVLKRECINPNARAVIEENLKRHAGTIPRWDTPDYPRDKPGYIRLYGYDVLCMEMWAHRTIDNHSASPMGLHIIEGVYGRDGDFNTGPNPFGSENNKTPWSKDAGRDGRPWDYMTNIVIFGKNPYLVDIVGHWLGGHEPGNFGLFHIAMERGKIGVLNPMSIPVYEWMDGVAVRRPLTSFTRTPLRTSYLQQHHKGEPLWHLCDEPFDYGKVAEKKTALPSAPSSRVLDRAMPTARNPFAAIEYVIPRKGNVMVEILDAKGDNLEVIVNAVNDPGYHMAAWNTSKYPSGAYKYRLRFDDFNEVRDITLKKA